MKFASLSCTYFGGNQNYRVDVSIGSQFWNFLFFEKFLTPIFEIKIENKEENIENGTIECYIAEWDNPNTRYSIEEKNFMHFQTFRFMNFEKGKILKFKSKINSEFIKHGKHIVRFIVRREVPYEKSRYEEMKEQYGETVKIRITEFDPPILAFSGSAKTWETVKLPSPQSVGSSGETPKVRIVEGTLDELVKKYPDWKKPKVGVKQGIPIGDYRWDKIVVVYSFNDLVLLITLIITIIGLIIGLWDKIISVISTLRYFLKL